MLTIVWCKRFFFAQHVLATFTSWKGDWGWVPWLKLCKRLYKILTMMAVKHDVGLSVNNTPTDKVRITLAWERIANAIDSHLCKHAPSLLSFCSFTCVPQWLGLPNSPRDSLSAYSSMPLKHCLGLPSPLSPNLILCCFQCFMEWAHEKSIRDNPTRGPGESLTSAVSCLS